jgi:6-phosphogluconolactonase
MPLNWPRIQVGLTDERWIEPTHTDSNEHLVRHVLLRGEAKTVQFHSLYNAREAPERGPEGRRNHHGHHGAAIRRRAARHGNRWPLLPRCFRDPAARGRPRPTQSGDLPGDRRTAKRLSADVADLVGAAERQAYLIAIAGRPKRTVASQAMTGKATTPIAALLAARKEDVEFSGRT